MLHGAYLAIHRLISDRFPRVSEFWFFKNRIGKLISIIVMQYFVFLAWIPFRVENFDDMIYSMYKFIVWDFDISNTFDIIKSNEISIILIILFLSIIIFQSKNNNIIDKIFRLRMLYWIPFITMCILSVVLFYGGTSEEFIYFRF